MNKRRFHIIIAATIVLGAVPSTVLGCTIPFRVLGPISVSSNSLRMPTEGVADRADYGLDESWSSTSPELNQIVHLTDRRQLRGIAYSGQRALSLDSAGPEDGGLRFTHDRNPFTAPCEIAGRAEWTMPRIIVRETATAVRIAAAYRRTPGERSGCMLAPQDEETACPNLARRIMVLKRPIGTRQLVLERF